MSLSKIPYISSNNVIQYILVSYYLLFDLSMKVMEILAKSSFTTSEVWKNVYASQEYKSCRIALFYKISLTIVVNCIASTMYVVHKISLLNAYHIFAYLFLAKFKWKIYCIMVANRK